MVIFYLKLNSAMCHLDIKPIHFFGHKISQKISYILKLFTCAALFTVKKNGRYAIVRVSRRCEETEDSDKTRVSSTRCQMARFQQLETTGPCDTECAMSVWSVIDLQTPAGRPTPTVAAAAESPKLRHAQQRLLLRVHRIHTTTKMILRRN